MGSGIAVGVTSFKKAKMKYSSVGTELGSQGSIFTSLGCILFYAFVVGTVCGCLVGAILIK